MHDIKGDDMDFVTFTDIHHYIDMTCTKKHKMSDIFKTKRKYSEFYKEQYSFRNMCGNVE